MSPQGAALGRRHCALPTQAPIAPGVACPGHTVSSLNGKSHVWGRDTGASVPRAGEGGVTSPQLVIPSLFCSPQGCKKSEAIYKQTGVPGEYHSPGE